MEKKGSTLANGAIFLAFVLLASILWGSGPLMAQENKGPIKIGIDTELTGVVSETSTNIKMGYDMYLQEIGYKVAGREIKIIENDNKTDYKVAMEAAQRLVEKDRVDILGFGTSSAAAAAIRNYTEKNKVPFVVLGEAGGEQVTLPPLKYTFRLSYADGQGELPLGHYAYEKLGYRKMVLMGPDYAGSTGKLWAFRQGFEKAGGQIVQTILWPLATMDLAPYFGQLKPGCDAIFPFIPGDISIDRFLGQYFELGLDKKGIKLCTHWTMTEDYLPLKTFGEKMLGITSIAMYCLDYDTPENSRVTQLYYSKYGRKKLMNTDVADGYETMEFLCAAIKAINGNVENTEALLKALHETKIKGVCSSSISVDGVGNNVIRDFFIRRVDKKDGVLKNVVIDVIPQAHQPPQGTALMPGKS